MKSAPEPLLSDHRLARLLSWAGLWLMRFTACLVTGAPPPRGLLGDMARYIGKLIFLRAVAMAPRRAHVRQHRPRVAPRGFRKRQRPSALMRSAVGSALRRQLRARGVAARVCALLYALANVDALAAKLAKRLAHRLTRLAAMTAVRPPAALLIDAAFAPTPAVADCS